MMLTDAEIDALFDESSAALEAKQTALAQRFGVGRHARWQADLSVPELVYLDARAKPRVHCGLLVVGTLGDGIWQWAWANRQLPAHVREPSAAMKRHAADTGLAVFEESKWVSSEEQAWMMTALACRQFDAAGAYRIPGSKADVYALLLHPRLVDAESSAV